MHYRFNPTTGSTKINWSMGPSGEPPLDPPEYWELESDKREATSCDENCTEDFLTSVEPD